MTDWVAVNLANWEDRVDAHLASPDYEVSQFHSDSGFLSTVVRSQLPLLGDVSGLRGVHLQCHIGTDTISLQRLGAQMTGLDFSPKALHAARELAAATGAYTDFVQAEFYDALDVLPGNEFDLVYTGVGALCWLPDIAKWAAVVAALLTPGGRLFLHEGHPMLWTLDDTRDDGVLAVRYPYFEQPEPDVFIEGGTYVSTDQTFEHNTTAFWNHGLGEIVTALLNEGLRLTMLVEHDTAEWNPLPGMTEKIAPKSYRLRSGAMQVPFTYTLQAVKD